MRTSDVTLGSFIVELGGKEILPSIERVDGDELDVVLLVDTSGSMDFGALDAAKASGASFIEQLPDASRISIVGFGDEATVAQEFTTDHAQAVATLNDLEASGETALHAAVVTAAQQFDPTRDSIRTVVLLSDGGNTVQQSSLGAAQAALQLSEATLHAISIETQEGNDAELESLAQASNGTVGRVEQLEALEQLHRAIGADLNHQYRLRFTAKEQGTQTAWLKATNGPEVLAETSVTLNLRTAPQASSETGNEAVLPPAIEPFAPEPTPAPVASPPTVNQLQASDNTALKWLSVGALGIAMAAICLVLFIPSQRKTRRAKKVKPSERFESKPSITPTRGLRWIAEKLGDLVEGGLNRRPIGMRVAKMLDAAGWKIRTSEFVALVGLAAGAGFLVGAVSSFGFGLTLAATVVGFVFLIVTLKAARRRSAFAKQLVPALQMLAGALRTGYSLPQAINLAAKEAEAPVGEEFARVAVEMRLGRDLVESLQAVAVRMKNQDFEWTVGAIDIAREVGGDLAGVLDNVGDTMRTRDRVRRQIHALSAEGRISAYILMILPFPMFFWQLLVNREYTGLLVTDPVGQAIFGTGIVALIVGGLWMRKLIKVEF